MPQLELKYSADLALDPTAIFTAMESTIQSLDTSAGICKSRAYPANEYLHSHAYCHINVLKKPHRNTAFMQQLHEALIEVLKNHIPKGSYYAVELDFSSTHYAALVS